MRLIDADEVMRDAEHISAFRHGLADLSDLAIALSGGHTIEAEPVRHSFWEEYETSSFGGYKDGEAIWWERKFFRCERCRKGSAIRSKYCPSCGAKMEG